MAKKRNDKGFGGDSHGDLGSFLKDTKNARMLVMTTAAEMGITPLEYSVFIQAYNRDGRDALPDDAIADFSDDFDDYGIKFERPYPVEEAIPLADADRKTLRLRIQLRDVTKPPLWREVEVPADYNFNQLNAVIQAVMGWMNCHLWQFQRRPYDNSLEIGIQKADQYGFGLEAATHDAEATPITGFLKKKGDKLVYVYDFGNDWIHDISVIEVEDKKIPDPVLLKWKGISPFENCGGAWGYMRLRDIYSGELKLSKKEEKEFLREQNFQSLNDFRIWIEDEHIPDIEFINGELLKETHYPMNPE